MIRLTPPTVPGYVSSGWGASRAYRGGWHAGLDFPAEKGSPILAAAPGMVDYVKNDSTSYAGKYTVINHGGGIYSRYLHADQNLVSVGDRVTRGQKIGLVGRTGIQSSGAHVHFDVKMLPSALERYEKLYGSPTTGFSDTMTWGRGVPAETLMDGATYKRSVVEASTLLGVRFFEPSLLGRLLVVAAMSYGAYKVLS